MGTITALLTILWTVAVADTGTVVDTGSGEDSGAPVEFVDIDCDGINDVDEDAVDRDGDFDDDGVSNSDEVDLCGTDPCTADADADGDGVSNADEVIYHTDACDPSDPDQTEDEDCDTIPDYRDEEVAFDDAADNDGDGVSNSDELGACASDPCVPNTDPDGDGVPTQTELACGSNPCSPDSDADGIWDADELGSAGDCGPDSDGDGVPDIIDPDNGQRHGATDDTIEPPSSVYGLEGGAFRGGACQTAGGSPAWLLGLLGLGLVLRRRRAAPMALALIVLPARAQEIDAQRFQPSVDGRNFVVIDDPLIGQNGPGGQVMVNHSAKPFLYRFPTVGTPDIPILGQVWTMDLLAHWNIRPVMIGLAAPIHLAAEGLGLDRAGSHTLGDMDVAAKVTVLNPRAYPVGLGISTRLGIPTGNGRAWLGQPGVTGTTLVGMSYGEDVVVAANVGVRLARATTFQGTTVGSAALWRAGVRVPLHDAVWVSTELDAAHHFGSGDASGTSPIEALFSTRVAPWSALVTTVGAGTGLSPGIGAPAYRVVFGIGWVPAAVPAPATPPPPRDEPPPPPEAPPEPMVVEPPAPVLTEPPPRVEVTETRIVIRERIFFEFDSAQIKVESHGLLDEIVVAILDHPELTLLEIQGHTDDQGTPEYNLKLSQARSEAVMLYMVQHSVDAQRLLARGHGETRPIENVDSDEARAINRRVEFHIIERQ